MKRTLIFFFFIPFISLGQSIQKKKLDSSFSIIKSLVRSKKITGSPYGKERLILSLTDSSNTQDYLIDSASHFKYLNSRKVSFLAYFNDAASDIKIGYIEINFIPYKTKVVFLSNVLISISSKKTRNTFTTRIASKTNERNGESTILNYKFISDCNSSELSKFFVTHKNIGKPRQ